MRRSSMGQETPISPGQSSKFQDERNSSVPLYEDISRGTNDCSSQQKREKAEIGCSGDSGEPRLAPKKIGDVNKVLKRENTSDMHHTASRPSLEGTNPGTSPSMSVVGDCALDTGSKSERILKLEETVNRLKSALVSLEEENLILNKKVKGTIGVSNPSSTSDVVLNVTTNNNKQENDCSSADSKLRETSLSLHADENHQDRRKQDGRSRNTESRHGAHKRGDPLREAGQAALEEERQEAQRKLQKVEEYCRECTKELGRVLRKYEEIRAQNKSLDKQNRQLTSDNQKLAEHLRSLKGDTRRGEEMLKENNRLKASLEEANRHCAQAGRDKEQLEGRVMALSGEVSRLTDELAASKLEAQRLYERRTLLDTEAKVTAAKLEEENRRLQDKLKESEQRSELSEGAVRKLKEDIAELESCFHTVQRERDILQLEVRKLHQEYIDLSNKVSFQLRGKNSSTFSASLGSHEALPSNFSGTVTKPDCPIGGEKIDQIRKRLEEEELQRAQRYQHIINQSV